MFVHLKYYLKHLASPLQAEQKFLSGITGLRKAENTSMLVLVSRARQQPMKTLKADDVGISFDSFQAIFTDDLGMKHA